MKITIEIENYKNSCKREKLLSRVEEAIKQKLKTKQVELDYYVTVKTNLISIEMWGSLDTQVMIEDYVRGLF